MCIAQIGIYADYRRKYDEELRQSYILEDLKMINFGRADFFNLHLHKNSIKITQCYRA